MLAPGLYFLTQSAASQFPILEKLAHNPFHRFVNRSMLVLALSGLWPLSRAMGFRKAADLGLNDPAKNFSRVTIGFAFGFLSLAVAAGMLMVMGKYQFNPGGTPADLLRHILNATLSAIVVAFTEELLFRGVLFGGLRKAISWRLTLIVVSAIYALVHFFAKAGSPPTITWLSGFKTLGWMFRGFLNFDVMKLACPNLFIAGLILGVAYQRTGTLYFSIGLHAGWVFWIKSFGFFARSKVPTTEAHWAMLLNSWCASIVLIILFWFLTFRWKPESSSRDAK